MNCWTNMVGHTLVSLSFAIPQLIKSAHFQHFTQDGALKGRLCCFTLFWLLVQQYNIENRNLCCFISTQHINKTSQLKTWHVPHACIPINCHLWFWHRFGKRSCCTRPCTPQIGRQLEILHTSKGARLCVCKFWLLTHKLQRRETTHSNVQYRCSIQCVFLAHFPGLLDPIYLVISKNLTKLHNWR